MKSLLLIFFCGAAIFSFSQDFQYKTYTEQDGLSSNHISCVLQDSDGFVWVATSNGLNRFDGNFFEHFLNSLSDSNSIASDEIQSLFIDRKKRLWIGTNAGISLYHPVLQSFSNYAPDTIVLPVIGVSFGALCDDNTGNLWVGTNNDLLIFNPVTQKFRGSGWAKYADRVCPVTSNRIRVIIMSIIAKSENELWILSTFGLFSINTSTLQFNYYPYSFVSDYFNTHLYYADAAGNVWISLSSGGFLCYNSSSGKWAHYEAPPELSTSYRTNSVRKYNGDTLMYCADRSIIFFDAAQKKFTKSFTHHPDEINSLPDADFKNVIRQENLIWLGTENGLVKIAPKQTLFGFHSLSSLYTINRVFHSSTGNLVFGENKEGVTLYVKKPNDEILPVYTSVHEPVHGDYQYFKETANGDAYVNGSEKLFYYDSKKNLAYEIPLPPKRFPDITYDIRNTVIDKEGTVWTRAIGQGILEYHPETKKMVLNEDIPVKRGKEINILYYDSLFNTLWVNLEFEGVFVYTIQKKSVQHYLLNIPPSQKGAGIIAITGDGKGNIYLVDYHSGIISYNSATKKFIRYSMTDGLISNDCTWLCFDSKGFLWITADNGISRMNTLSKTFYNYYTNEGFPETFPFLSSDKEGNVYMPSGKGYYQWNASQSSDPAKSGNLYLRSAELSGKNIPVDSQYYFSYSENNIKFQFGYLLLQNNMLVSFEYKLNNGNWLNAGKQAAVSFASLSPDNYDLLVRLKNDPGKILHIHFLIAAPYWQTGWFRLLFLLLLALIIIFFVRRRMKAIRRKVTLKHRLAELEMAALRSQMNPHFIFNTLNSINSYIIENKTDEASDYLTEFSQLMRIILEHSKEKLVQLGDDLKALKLYMELESKRLERSFDYRIEISPETDATSIEVPPLIMQPFVENAIWHGLRNKKGTGFIDIRVEKKKDDLHISITDDGIGREEAKKFQKLKDKTSFGIQATLKRLVLHYPGSSVTIEDLRNEKQDPCGTKVDIFFKLKKSGYARSNH